MEGAPEKSVVERLRAEKAEDEKEYFEVGIIDGLEDGPTMSYRELNILARQYKELARPEADDAPEVDLDAYEWLKERIHDMERADDGFNENAYLAGWINGVLEFFDSIEAEL